MPQQARTHPNGGLLLLFVVASILAATVGQRLLLGNGDRMLVTCFKDLVHLRSFTDSWGPMTDAVEFTLQHPGQSPYSAAVYNRMVYPPESLVPLWLLGRAGVSAHTILTLLRLTSALAVLLMIPALLWLAQLLLSRRQAKLDPLSAAAIAVAVLGCYPILRAYSLGNAQTFLTLGFFLLLALWVQGLEISAGVVLGLMACLKPQLGLLLLWALLRQRWKLSGAFLATCAAALLAGILIFGWHAHVEYLRMLSQISRGVQASFVNQSFYATINRMIGNGENLTYTPYKDTPFIPWVYWTSVALSLGLLVISLIFPWGRLRGSALDLSATAIAAVAVSPMAWEHHFSICLGIAVLVWFGVENLGRFATCLLAISSFLTFSSLQRLNRLAPHHGINLLQSYVLLGALVLFFLLLVSTASRKPPAAPAILRRMNRWRARQLPRATFGHYT